MKRDRSCTSLPRYSRLSRDPHELTTRLTLPIAISSSTYNDSKDAEFSIFFAPRAGAARSHPHSLAPRCLVAPLHLATLSLITIVCLVAPLPARRFCLYAESFTTMCQKYVPVRDFQRIRSFPQKWDQRFRFFLIIYRLFLVPFFRFGPYALDLHRRCVTFSLFC